MLANMFVFGILQRVIIFLCMQLLQSSIIVGTKGHLWALSNILQFLLVCRSTRGENSNIISFKIDEFIAKKIPKLFDEKNGQLLKKV